MTAYYWNGMLINVNEERGTYYLATPTHTTALGVGYWRSEIRNDSPFRVMLERILNRDTGDMRVITDGKFPGDLFKAGVWECVITVSRIKPIFVIADLEVNIADANPVYLTHNSYIAQQDTRLMDLTLRANRDGWQFSEKDWHRVWEDAVYAQYRLTGNIPTEIVEMASALEEKFASFTQKRLLATWIEAKDSWSWRTDIRRAIWQQYLLKHKKEMNRKRKIYVAGEAHDFRLIERFGNVDELPDDVMMLIQKTPDDLVRVMIEEMIGDRKGYKPVLKAGTYPSGLHADVFLHELHTYRMYEAEGDDMVHCIGDGWYFNRALENGLRAFHADYDMGNGDFAPVTLTILRNHNLDYPNCPNGWHVDQMYGPEDEGVPLFMQNAIQAALEAAIGKEWIPVEVIDLDVRVE